VCGLLDALDALAALVPISGAMVMTGGGARSRAFRQVLADLSGRVVVVPEVDEAVATGACVQAAAVLQQRPMDEVQRAWGLGRGHMVEPGPGSTAAADVRAAYAARRDREA
jgi:xylulokinase